MPQVPAGSPLLVAPLFLFAIGVYPFELVGIDLIGPFEPSTSGWCFMLLLVDYAIWYPEVMGIHNASAQIIVTKLLKILGVSLPWEILRDQGTISISLLQQKVWTLLKNHLVRNLGRNLWYGEVGHAPSLSTVYNLGSAPIIYRVLSLWAPTQEAALRGIIPATWNLGSTRHKSPKCCPINFLAMGVTGSSGGFFQGKP